MSDAEVLLRGQPPEGQPPLQVALAPAAGMVAGYYEADVELATAGRWQVQVVVSGPAGGGQAAFELEVRAARRVPPLVWGALGLLVVLGGWFWSLRSTEDEHA